jgi:hypothetical protein
MEGQVDTGRVTHLPQMHRQVLWKSPVRVATTANGTLATAFDNGSTIDGVVLATGDRILIKNQTDATVNGLYVVNASGAPSRTYDMDDGDEMAGAMVLVMEGSANAGKLFYCTNIVDVVLGDDDITWAEFSGAGGADLSGIDFLVGTASGLLSAEIVAGTVPGGELGGTWASPTVDGTHSGSAHADFVAKSTFNAKGDLLTATANDTPSIKTAGANDTILMADSAQSDGLKWVGSQTPSTQDYSDVAAEGTADTYARGDHQHGMPADPGAAGGSVAFDGIYGDGHDGDVTISVDTTPVRDMYYHDLTVDVGVSLIVRALRIFVSGTLTLNGTIHHNTLTSGGNGGNGSSGVGGTAGAAGAAPATGASQSLPNGVAGLIGKAGAAGDANGTAGTTSTRSGMDIAHSTSGAGGNSGTGRTGGAGIAAAADTTVVDRPYHFPAYLTVRTVSSSAYAGNVIEGFAPSSGSGAGSASSGGGGSGGSGGGGGRLVVAARVITGGGNIEAKGGNGGNGGNGGGANAGGGGGGNGGAGGWLVVLYKDATGWSGSALVTGGTHGTPGTGVGSGSSGTNGADGPAGHLFVHKMG